MDGVRYGDCAMANIQQVPEGSSFRADPEILSITEGVFCKTIGKMAGALFNAEEKFSQVQREDTASDFCSKQVTLTQVCLGI